MDYQKLSQAPLQVKVMYEALLRHQDIPALQVEEMYSLQQPFKGILSSQESILKIIQRLS